MDNNLFNNKIIFLKMAFVTVGFLFIILTILSCPFVKMMPGENTSPLGHIANSIEMTLLIFPQNIFNNLAFFIILSVVLIIFSNLKYRQYLNSFKLLFLKKAFFRKYFDILYLAQKLFYSWFSLFESSPNIISAT